MDSVQPNLAPPEKLVIITGPSGVGKGTVCRQLLPVLPSLQFCVSATTRAMREGEVDGADYHFLSEQDFQARIDGEAFLEWAQYATSYYGTLKSEITRMQALDKIPLLEIDTQGALQVKSKVPDAMLIFITPPTFDALKERLIGRGTNTPEDIQRRLQIAEAEMKKASQFDVVIENDNLVDTVMNVAKAIENYLC